MNNQNTADFTQPMTIPVKKEEPVIKKPGDVGYDPNSHNNKPVQAVATETVPQTEPQTVNPATSQPVVADDPQLQNLSPQPKPPIISRKEFDATHPQQAYSGPSPAVLIVLDGWGIGPNNAGNAIARANTPNLDKYWMSFPHTQLAASGEAVGLPHGEDGNTETGHLNIGAGNIVYQDLPRINMAIADGTFNTTPAFINAFNHVRQNNSTLHLMGLIGAGGVHSNIEHLYALLNLCKKQGISKVYIHGFTDGRDSPPTSGINYVQQINDLCAKLGVGKIASLMGRFYAMDRDKRWDRIEKSYTALTTGSGQCSPDPISAMQAQYDKSITDEFIEPITICDESGAPLVINDNDGVIFFNYRIDRPRELTRAFVQPDFERGVVSEAFDPYQEKYEKTNIQKEEAQVSATFSRKKVLKNLYFVTMTRYEDGIPVDIAFPPQFVKSPLGQVFAQHGLRQLRATETEKERFVSYYMNGQKNDLYPGEERVTIPSKGVKSYDTAPEMSAREIVAEIKKRVEAELCDVVITNICNGDMVGHTGNLEATITACEIVDEVVGDLVKTVVNKGGVVFITADHGNAEELINNNTGEKDTEHSIYPVPLMIISRQFMGQNTMLPTGILADVAPTMLKIMGIPKPDTMTGRALL
ncbi:MAG: 2,3-bisphosphoglycerate-independent phosphoglycerate mutase [Candidatus Pacebacteria bacterium]|nr:2,3-bisphosphoglycerate-independent phosphoglycerate mutase [Candidatus Paceibacterota bacterium]